MLAVEELRNQIGEQPFSFATGVQNGVGTACNSRGNPSTFSITLGSTIPGKYQLHRYLLILLCRCVTMHYAAWSELLF